MTDLTLETRVCERTIYTYPLYYDSLDYEAEDLDFAVVAEADMLGMLVMFFLAFRKTNLNTI